MSISVYGQVYSENNIRSITKRITPIYEGLDEFHVYWIAKQLGIYPNAEPYKKSQRVNMTKTGSINRNSEYVTDGKVNEKGIRAIETYLEQEGYKKTGSVEAMQQQTNIWDQADLISLMKKDYDKAVAERDAAKAEADQYAKMADKYEKEIEDLKDKLIISEKENSSLKSEKQELSKMQMKTIDFNREIESLQKRIGQYNAEINAVSAEVNEFRKDVSALLTGVNMLQEKKKKLEGVMSDLVGCSKRLMNMK